MSFLNPWVLMGLAAAAIPVLVHFFNLRRPRTIDFSSLAFVQRVEKSSMRRVKIKEWLLLALRVLAVVCLVLAFARPTLTGEGGTPIGGRAPVSMAIVVDNSLSMQVRDDQGAYLQQAKARAMGLIDQMQPDDDVRLRVATDTAGTAAPYKNAGPAREAVEAIEARPGARSLAEAGREAQRALRQASRRNRELYLISDLQATTLADSLDGAAETEAGGSNMRVRLLPVGRRRHANVAVTDVQVKSRIVEVGQPVRIEATLKNFSDEAREGYMASCYLGGERLAQASADLGAREEQVVTFQVTPRRRGWLDGTIEIEDDLFTPDNERPFVLHVPRVRRVLVVRGDGQNPRYVQAALSSEMSEGQLAFQVETIGEGALAGTSPGSYDVIVLVGLQELASGERAALARYVSTGGGLLIFPSQDASLDDYNALFRELEAGRLTGFSGSSEGGQPVAAFERVDTQHPLFEGVFEDAGGQVRPERPEIYQVANYAPRAGTEQTLIELTNGRPFLQEIRHEQGAALLMTVAPVPQWSDLPTRGLFVPLLYRSLYYLSAGAANTGEALVAGQGGELRVTGVTAEAPLRLVGPGGQEYRPRQRRLFGAVLLQVSAAIGAPGVYDVMQADQLVRRVAVGLDPRESDLQVLAADEAADRLGEVFAGDVDLLEAGGANAARVAEALRTERTGREIWNVFLMLALAFLVAEMVVARQWTPETSS